MTTPSSKSFSPSGNLSDANEPAKVPALDQMRLNYSLDGLDEHEVASSPFDQFQTWFAEAGRHIPEWLEINAMTLATSDPGGDVTSRIVLLKGIESNRFLFYTNYQSTKGTQIAANPRVSISFYWPHLQRQVHVRGTVTKVDRASSLSYFRSRPRDSQLGAHASEQSTIVDSREALETAMSELERRYPEGTAIPVPEHWGGYAITPSEFEFWQGRPSRLHDRIVYQRNEEAWQRFRRSP